MSVRKAQREISSREFSEWQEYYKKEPFGDDWDQAATIAHAASAPHLKKPKPKEDFKPKFKRHRFIEAMAPSAIYNTLKGFFSGSGAFSSIDFY